MGKLENAMIAYIIYTQVYYPKERAKYKRKKVKSFEDFYREDWQNEELKKEYINSYKAQEN